MLLIALSTYEENMKEYEENMKKYEEIWENMKKYEGNMKKYVVNMKEYVERSETWKNSELYSLYRLGGLEDRSTERSERRVVVYSFLPV